jgi:hypothetical protein
MECEARLLSLPVCPGQRQIISSVTKMTSLEGIHDLTQIRTHVAISPLPRRTGEGVLETQGKN